MKKIYLIFIAIETRFIRIWKEVPKRKIFKTVEWNDNFGVKLAYTHHVDRHQVERHSSCKEEATEWPCVYSGRHGRRPNRLEIGSRDDLRNQESSSADWSCVISLLIWLYEVCELITVRHDRTGLAAGACVGRNPRHCCSRAKVNTSINHQVHVFITMKIVSLRSGSF